MSHRDALHTEEYRGYKIHLYQDEDQSNPRTEWDNVGVMCCSHRRYTLSDKDAPTIRTEDHSGWEEVAEWLRKEHGAEVILPLYLYDHSGITMSTGPFSCPWGSGQVGFIYATREKVLAEWGGKSKRLTKAVRAKAEKCLQREVETYDAFLRGDVVGYVVEDKDGETVDSCWGFYPDEKGKHSYAISEAKSHVDWERKDHAKKLREARQRRKDEALAARIRELNPGQGVA